MAQQPPRTAVMANVTSTLVVQHLAARRGDVYVLDDVSLEVRPLELHGLVGPSGAGKTALFEAIAGFLPASGDVMLGHVPLDREQRRQHVFYVPDGITPFADERTGATLRFAARSLGSTSLLDDVIERVQLRPALSRRVRDLSRGDRKRLLIAMGLLVQRGFVLIDEPFDGLDVASARAMQNVLRTSTNEHRALLCALHQMSEAEKLCDRFTLLSNGRVRAAGQIHELRTLAKVHPGASLEEVFSALA